MPLWEFLKRGLFEGPRDIWGYTASMGAQGICRGYFDKLPCKGSLRVDLREGCIGSRMHWELSKSRGSEGW